MLGPPRCRSIPVLALQAQLPTGLASRPTRRGTRPPQVLMAQGAKGRSRQAGPSDQSTNKTSSEHVKGTGGDVEVEISRVVSPVPTAGASIGAQNEVGGGGEDRRWLNCAAARRHVRTPPPTTRASLSSNDSNRRSRLPHQAVTRISELVRRRWDSLVVDELPGGNYRRGRAGA